MFARLFIVLLVTILGAINCFLFGFNTIRVTDLRDLLALENRRDVKCSINKPIDLEGKTVRLPANSYVVIKKGVLKNGTVVMDTVMLKCKDGAFEDVILRGTIRNDAFVSSWLKINGEYADLYADAIRMACNSNADFVFTKGTYRFKHPLFLYNKMSLYGKGNVILEPEIESIDNKGVCFIVAGNDDLNINDHMKGMEWQGSIYGLTININEKQQEMMDAVIGLYNSSNSSVHHCYIDASYIKVPVGHFIGAFNNARYANPSGGHHLHIYSNMIKCQGSVEMEYSDYGQLLSCESIGVANRYNIVIDHNHIINASDDLGIHSCNNVQIFNNTLESLDGRIYVSGSQDCTIENNRIKYISPSQSGMGIKVTIEFSYQKPNKRFTIVNNVVDYSGASDSPNYGIWVQGQDILIEKNMLISNGASNARIWIDVIDIDDNQDARAKNKGVLVPDRIVIKNNKAKTLYCVADSKLEVKDWEISNNIIEGDWYFVNRKEAVQKSNIVNGREK